MVSSNLQFCGLETDTISICHLDWTVLAGVWHIPTCLMNSLENLTGNSHSGQSNTYQTERLTHAIVKVYRLRTVCLEYQGVLTQRMVLRLG